MQPRPTEKKAGAYPASTKCGFCVGWAICRFVWSIDFQLSEEGDFPSVAVTGAQPGKKGGGAR